MKHAPLTTILASATMPNWDLLPSWWKGRGTPATRTVISLVRVAGGRGVGAGEGGQEVRSCMHGQRSYINWYHAALCHVGS